MPEMDGWTATALIKKDEQTVAIPLIALTAHALPGDRQRAMDAGCDEYITKPMDLDELVETVQYWVKSIIRCDGRLTCRRWNSVCGMFTNKMNPKNLISKRK